VLGLKQPSSPAAANIGSKLPFGSAVIGALLVPTAWQQASGQIAMAGRAGAGGARRRRGGAGRSEARRGDAGRGTLSPSIISATSARASMSCGCIQCIIVDGAVRARV
jgi:hypothetical protein